MIELALVIGVGTLTVGVLAAFVLRLLPTMRMQLVALALVSVAAPLTAVLATGWVMFHMHDDVKILMVSVGSALSAAIGGLLLAHWIVQPIDALRTASSRLSDGDLSARAPLLARPGELAELATAFNGMAGSLERLFDARRQLIAWASHDLRTPVAAMQAMLEALEDGLAAPADYLPALGEQTQALALLIDDLFELVRIDSGLLTLQLRKAELGDIVDCCLRTLDAEARSRGVELRADVDLNVPPLLVAPDKVERILLNLLTNALRHTPADGSVAVLVETRAADVVVAVEDTGSGLEPGSEGQMFDRFWKLDESRTRTEGSGAGLGLAIARGLVEAHGGRIWAEQRAGGGARIVFALPAP